MSIDTKQYGTHVLPEHWDLPMAAGAVGTHGYMAALNASNLCVPASASATLRIVGKFMADADNTGGAAGDIKAKVESGCFPLVNGAGADEFLATDRPGIPVFLSGPYTACKTDGSAARPFTGFFVGLLGGKVIVSVSPLHQKPLTTAEALALAGIRTGSATLVAGTVTVTLAGVTASSRIQVTMTDPGAGAITGFADFKVTKGSGTFDITAIDAAKATIATAVCVVDYTVIG